MQKNLITDDVFKTRFKCNYFPTTVHLFVSSFIYRFMGCKTVFNGKSNHKTKQKIFLQHIYTTSYQCSECSFVCDVIMLNIVSHYDTKHLYTTSVNVCEPESNLPLYNTHRM